MTQTLSEFSLGDITARYLHNPSSGGVGLLLFPSTLTERLVKRPTVSSSDPSGVNPEPEIDSLVQVKILGDPYPGTFASGHTMRQSASNRRFRFHGQHHEASAGRTSIHTTLRSDEELTLKHILHWRETDRVVEIETIFHNGSAPVTLEMLSSFSLGGITPFAPDDAPARLRVHRFRSLWSAEGRHESRTIEELHLERSWSGVGSFSERFGQIGSMPVRKWFPFAAIEDTGAGVLWGAQLAWAGSWQMEIFRQQDDIALSGGLADREFGHWKKTIMPGEQLDAPPAVVTCSQGSIDDLCDRLTTAQHRAADNHPEIEADLPIVFNEWCTTWGEPSHENISAIADRLAGTEARYLIIDAGWFKSDKTSWYTSHGDWQPNARLFPHGIEATADAIRERGLIPGLWFEMETCGETSSAFSLVDHLLQRDGLPVTTNSRRFWNLNDPWVIDYLSEKVIGLLRKGRFGYMKVDYNETIGLGSDHPDSLGEGLRQQTLGTYKLFEKIRKALPDLVIENCASGGHRLEPSMLARTAMSSFSDAHETAEIPIVAANLHSLLLPRQSQIWAVLHASDSAQRLAYSLAATFLGRMCLSGEIMKLAPERWALVREAMSLYRTAAPIIKHGTSRRFSEMGQSWRHPQGWQAVRRVAADGRDILVVLHTFASAPDSVKVPLPEGSWHIATQLNGSDLSITPGLLVFAGLSDFRGSVVILRKTAE